MELGRLCQQPGILLSPGAEVVALDRHIFAVPFHTFFGTA
jgi:hypothetical protein